MTKLKWWVGLIAMLIGGEPEPGCLAFWISEHPEAQKS